MDTREQNKSKSIGRAIRHRLDHSRFLEREEYAWSGATPRELHKQRVETEMTAAGMSQYGHMKWASHFAVHLIGTEEHVKGVIYGRYDGGEGEMIATDQRVLFIDKKPLFTRTDEISYGGISGVTYSSGGLFAAVTLHTREGDFHLHYAPKWAAQHFVDYVEGRKAEKAIYFMQPSAGTPASSR